MTEIANLTIPNFITKGPPVLLFLRGRNKQRLDYKLPTGTERVRCYFVAMEHEFRSETEGVWVTPEKQQYCRWKFDAVNRTIEVETDGTVLLWQAPVLEHHVDASIRLDVPETAKDIAAYLRRRRALPVHTSSVVRGAENKGIREVISGHRGARNSIAVD